MISGEMEFMAARITHKETKAAEEAQESTLLCCKISEKGLSVDDAPVDVLLLEASE